MARTKKSTAESGVPPATVNGEMHEVWTLAEAAGYLRLPEKDVLAAAASQGLPGRQVGGEWRFLRSAIQEWLSASQPSKEMRKAAILELAGKYKDDPDLEKFTEEAMRWRGRPQKA